MLTFAITIAACFQAIFACLQWLIYRQQLKSSMPLVVIDWENMIHVSPPTDGGSPMAHYFNWGVRNTGSTPAFVTGTSARFVTVPTGEGIPKMEYAPPEPYIEEPLFTKANFDEDGLNLWKKLEGSRSFDEVKEAIRSKTETLYAFGYVCFRDRYGKPHKTTFCLRYYASERYDSSRDGFGYAGIAQNRYT